MAMEYSYSFGGIKNVVSGELDKVNSLDDLQFSSGGGLVIVPKVIGVYQRDTEMDSEAMAIIEYMENLFSLRTSMDCRSAADLICVAYDPTTMSEKVLREFVGNSDRRIKIVNCTEIPDFYDKVVPNFLKPNDVDFSHRVVAEKWAVLEKEKNIYELLRQDYGLTRRESINLDILGNLMKRGKGSLLESGSDFRDLLK